jgi:YVTN family beta-propeller protein
MAADPPAGKAEPDAFGVLGPLQVLRSGRAVPLGGPRQRAVLALLLLEAGRVVSMDRLAEDVWAGHPPEEWANTLQTYVFHLRQALEPGRTRGDAGGVLVTSGRGYLLRAGRDQLDAAVFEDGFTAGRAALAAGRYAEAAEVLRQALGLWRGPVLADLADYAFTRPEAARLEDLRLAAVEDRIDADLALGRHQALTGELERLAGEHPLRERLHGQLMLALYRCGRQADALAAYRRARDLLAGELGIDPGEPLQRLHASVLAHDPALDWKDGTPARAGVASGGAEMAIAGAAGRDQAPGRSRLAGFRASVHAAVSPVLATEPARARRRARRLLAAGSALAVAAAVSIVVVARPWAAGEAPAQLPADSVGLVDSAGGRVGAAVPVGSPDGVAYGRGSVWVVDGTDGKLFRIDPVTHARVDHIDVGPDPSAVTVSRNGDVWVANSGDGTVSWISPATDKPVGPPIPVGNQPGAIASGPSGVWVANQGDDTVYQINPVTGTVTRKVPVGGLPDGIAVGPDAVWVANGQDGTVTRIDPVTGQPSGPFFVGAGPAGIAVTPSAVWVANLLDRTVSKINPLTGQVTGLVRVGDGPSAIVAAKNSVWVSDQFDATLDRIDPRTGRVTRTVPVGSSPHGLALTSSGVWVAARPFAAASHRGGTLTEVSNTLPLLDPAQANDYMTVPALATVYDGLVAFRRSAGAPGLTLVPDLALTLPRPADGGRSYTFTLRPGIRYSNGIPVRASDFRHGIERQLTYGPTAAYYQGILGARGCQPPPRRCDLSAGIIADNRAGTVTFRLNQADPEFLDKLALLLATPAPAGIPDRPITGPPFLPGTGPYEIASYVKNRSLTLKRNPHFHQWSYAAQPAGYPDVIRFEQLAKAKQESAVAAGRADLVDISWNGLPYGPLAIRYPGRVHPGFKIFTLWVFLNTRRPPFNSLKARQAVSYAINREHIIQLLGAGADRGAVTCQLLPADFPGYQPYCPYTTPPHDGTWHSPDLATGRRLARESGTTSTPVTVWNDFGNVSSYLVQLLRQLGYPATLRHISASKEAKAFLSPHSTAQAGISGFGADLPTASNYFFPDLSCRSLQHPNPNGALNLSWYCNPHADKLARQAQDLQVTAPAAARRAWAQLYRLISNQAPVVPVSSGSPTVFVSARVRNYQEQPIGVPLLDQMQVR